MSHEHLSFLLADGHQHGAISQEKIDFLRRAYVSALYELLKKKHNCGMAATDMPRRLAVAIFNHARGDLPDERTLQHILVQDVLCDLGL